MFKILGKEELELQQWSSDEKVINPCMDEGDEVVFVNGKGKHIVTQAYRMDGTVVADVPNEFLQQKGNILVYLEQGKNRHHECETVLSVLGCAKPNGYKCKKNEKVFPPNQANWNQNDPTKADYVKNRPFYAEMAEKTVECTSGMDGDFLDGFPAFVVGDTVTVKVDGVTHSLAAYDDDGYATIGDPWAELEKGLGQLGWQIYESCFNAKEAHSVSYMAEIVNKIPEKYLPVSAGGSYDFVGAAYSNQRFEILSGSYEAVKAKLESGIIPNIIVLCTLEDNIPFDISVMARANGFYIYRASRIALFDDYIWCEMDDRATGLSINADGTMFFGTYD